MIALYGSAGGTGYFVLVTDLTRWPVRKSNVRYDNLEKLIKVSNEAKVVHTLSVALVEIPSCLLGVVELLLSLFYNMRLTDITLRFCRFWVIRLLLNLPTQLFSPANKSPGRKF